jgi:uncharacterized membrane protein YdjX (TVP38/TMEM64 family)
MNEVVEPTVPVPQSEPAKPARFSWKNALSLVFAVGVTAAVFIFRNEIGALQELGYLGVFLTMAATSATLILPAPGLAFVFFLGKTMNPLLLGLVAGAGSTLGEITGYLAGYSGNGVVENTDAYKRIEESVKKYGLIPIIVLAAIPNPLFDIAGFAAGALGIPMWKFLLATLFGKTIKTIAVAYAGFYGMGWVESLFPK